MTLSLMPITVKIEWAKMSSQETQEYGGEQQVHEFMLSELTVAARVAGQLQGKEASTRHNCRRDV